ncbi:MAG: hypothetical protein HYU42_14460 [Candidatus Rokubacteria bacterium]|nr:hypothetical protein [Candidatus Rokubacteria bacterium]MBI3104623.1 hypothetical protein [Candidatus Rokubacteria bacterium]
MTAFVVGVAAVGIALMFSFGNTWVVAKGDNRVGLSLAQQKIEQLKAMPFQCVPVPPLPGNGAGGPGTAGQTFSLNGVAVPLPQQPCPAAPTYIQVYNEPTWTTVTATNAPAPSDRNFIRLTCVQFVSETDFSLPAFAGSALTGLPCDPYVDTSTSTSCTTLGGSCVTTNVKRVTVIVRPTQQIQGDDPVVLQSWITPYGRL